jgi:hypothetical protein
MWRESGLGRMCSQLGELVSGHGRRVSLSSWLAGDMQCRTT